VTCKHENVVRIGGEIGLLFNWLGLEPTVSSFSFGSKNVKIRSGEKVEKPETWKQQNLKAQTESNLLP
jgi:hypothetical protein